MWTLSLIRHEGREPHSPVIKLDDLPGPLSSLCED